MQNIIEGFRLSPQQERLWLLQQDNDVYRAYCSLKIDGRLSIPTLFHTVETVCSRHEIYRTSLRRPSQMKLPVQVVNTLLLYTWRYVDLRNCSSLDQQKMLVNMAQEGLTSSIDLEEGPFVQCMLFTLNEDKHILFVYTHSVYADTSTLYHFTKELVHCYENEVSSMAFDHEGVQYLQFSEWQHALLEGKEESNDNTDERKKNSEAISSLSFPFECKSFELTSFSPAIVEIPIASDICASIEVFLKKQQASLPVFLLACWQILLWRLTGRDDLLIGLAIDGRVYQDLATIAGPLVKDMPFIGHLSEDLSFGKLLTQTNEAQTKLLSQYPYFSWKDLVSNASNTTISLLYPFGFDFREQPTAYEVETASFSLQQCYVCSEPFKVKLIAVRSGSSLKIEIHYDANVFDRRDMHRVACQFTTLVECAMKQPEARINELDMLGPVERKWLLAELNQTQSDYPQDLCLHQLIEQQIADTPDAIAIYDDEKQLTYRGLDRWANRVARHLQVAGVQPEVLVGLCLPRSAELLVSILGILKAGGAYVPLDPTSPKKRLTSIATDAHLSILLTTKALLDSLPKIEHTICLDTEWDGLAQGNDEHVSVSNVVSTNLVYVIYTSGSTGQSKGVMISHQGLVHYVHWACESYEVTAGNGTLLHSSLGFDLTVTSLFPPLVAGRPVWIVAEDVGIDALTTVLRTSPDFSIVKLTPAHLDLLNQSLASTDLVGTTRMLIIGGEALRGETLSAWHLHAPAIRLINEYGPTETVVGCCIYEVPRQNLVRGSVPIGRPIANTQLYLLDQHMQPVPAGVVAEVYIGGVGLGRGYLHRADLTANYFVPHPFSSEAGARLYKTGDLARYVSADGDLEYVGRIDHQIKIRGYRVELGEIEGVLAQHPAVRECVVLAREDSRGDQELVAYVVGIQPDASLTTGLLREYLREYLPSYMLPASFVLLKEFPLTINGKVDRQAILALESQDREKDSIWVGPRTAIQELLLAIWSDVLGQSQLSIHDDFFELGGHSLLATRLMARIRAMLQVELPVQAVFETPTVAGIAQLVEQALRKDEALAMPALVVDTRPEEIPLSYSQQRLWFLDQLEPESSAYLVPSVFKMEGELDVHSLQWSVQELIGRHESLRTTFAERDGRPVQVIHPASYTLLPVIDLQALRLEQREEETRRLVRQEAQRPCDLNRGPLLRVSLARVEMQAHVLLLTLHHIITDGWSNEVMVRELITLYQASTAGEPSPLAPLPIQYADYALWQRGWLQGEVLQAQLAYWRTQLAEVSPLALPTDHPRPAMQTFRGASQPWQIPLALSQQVQALSQHEHVTLFMTLLASFQVLLLRYSGQSDISIGTPIANRQQAQSEGVIGFFVNTLVLRSDLSGNPSFVEVLRRVRKVCLGAYAHQDVPFERVVEAVETARDLSRSPLFQVLFTLQNVPQERGEVAGIQVRSLSVESTVSKFDLSLSVEETEQGLHCSLQYNPDLFEARTIERLLGSWHTLLAAIVQQPQTPIWNVPLLPPDQLAPLLPAPSALADAPLAPVSLSSRFEQQVAATPDAIALVCAEQHLTYHDLNRRVNQLAHLLRSRGVGPEVIVGIALDRSPSLVLALLAVVKAGGAYLPLDPTAPSERLAALLQEAHVHLVLALKDGRRPDDETTTLYLDGEASRLASQPQDNLRLAELPGQLFSLLSTSGSTGSPKVTGVTRQGFAHLLAWFLQSCALTPQSRVLVPTATSFDLTQKNLLAPLLAGGSLHLLPAGPYDPSLLCQNIAEQAITFVNCVPTMWYPVLDHDHARGFASLSSLRQLLTGGEALSIARLQPWLDAPQCQVQVLSAYGPTECTDIVTFMALQQPKRYLATTVPVGRALPYSRLYLLDAWGNPALPGSVGELYVGGEGVARGYVGRAGETATHFVPDPFGSVPGARLYRTGDLMRVRADETLEFVGRLDDQVKIRGVRIELGEIEAAVSAHPQVREQVVLACEEESGDKRLVAYVVAQPGTTLTGPLLRTFLQARLPLALLPAAFVFLDALPLTPNGKVDRRALPVPQEMLEEASPEDQEPKTPVEELLMGLWSQVLGRKQLGRHDNFFELGGHSLLATQLIGQVRKLWAVEIPLRVVFEAPTIAEFAQRVEQAVRQEETLALPALVAGARPEQLPLSFAQQRLWFLDQLEPESTVYLIPSAFKMEGELDVQSLEWSLQELIDRHESLRTTFVERDGQPMQVIQPAGPVVLPVIDLHELRHEQRDVHAHALATQEAQRPVDLAQGPLLRSALLRLDPDAHVLLLTLHHIITDGWSNEVMVRELITLYRASVTGVPSPLAPLPIQYADYALWQRGWLQGEVLQAQLAYWRTQLADASPLTLPTDHPRPAVQTFRGASQQWQLPLALSQEIQALSQREHVTLFMTLLASFQVFLSRYSGQSDISVGTPIANRQQAESEGVIGFFVNTLVLRSDLSGNPSFAEVLRRVREVCLGAYAHQDVPFEQVVEALEPERDLSRSPLFQVMLVLQNMPQEQEAVAGLQVHSLNVESVNSKFDLTLSIGETEQGLQCSLEYSTDLFEAQTIPRLLTHWQTLLQGVLHDPYLPISLVPLLSPQEHAQLLTSWNATQHDYPQELGGHHLVEQQVQRTPDAIALVFEEQHLSYGELNRRANQLAHHLQTLGVGLDVLVGICLERSLEMGIVMLAVLKAGGAYVPLDPSYPQERLAFIIQDAQLAVLVTQSSLLTHLPHDDIAVVCLDEDRPSLALQSEMNPLSAVDPESLAYVIYTSGSTGLPKGAMVEQRGMLNHICAKIDALTLTDGDKVAQTASQCFDISVWQFLAALLVGGSVQIYPDEVAHDPVQLLTQVDRHQVSILETVPSLLRAMLNADEMKAASRPKLETLRWLVPTGEALAVELCQRWLSVYPHVPLLNAYGPTECSDDVTHYPIYEVPDEMNSSIPIGRPIPNMRLYVLDRHLEPLPIGVSGELYVGGIGVGRGYLGDEQRTAEAFIPDSFGSKEGARLYKTGDLARYLPDGNIEFLGRLDFQVKLRGFRIELGEIEAVLGQHPNVQEGMVLAREDRPGEKRLVAYVVVQPRQSLSSSDLRAYLQDRLPGYLIPATFVFLGTLPLTPNGKVDRRALPVPQEMLEEASPADQASRTPVEELLLGLWSQVLGRQQLGRHDNFFELGGHSLLATQLIGRVRQVFAIELPLRVVFEAPNVAAFAQEVERALREGEALSLPALVAHARPEQLPLSFAQQRLWFLDQLEPESTTYLIPLALRVRGALDARALERSVETLIGRHESLRTVFVEQAGQPTQLILPPDPHVLPVIDLGALEPVQREQQVQDLVRQEALHPCDLAQGPLLRTSLLRLERDTHVFLLTLHHIITDGWSSGVLVRELTTLYQASVAGKPSPLAPLPIQYADYALWQRHWLQGEVLQQHIAYWKTQLWRVKPLELPTDVPHTAAQGNAGATYSSQFSMELSHDLVKFSQQEGVTMFMLLLTIFQIVLSRLSGQTDIVLGTDVANRTHVETEGLIGFFVNLVALRTDLQGTPRFRKVLQHVRAMVLGAYTHQALPFEMVVEQIQAERDASRAPVVQALFVMQNTPPVEEELPDVTFEIIAEKNEIAKFDISMFLHESEHGLSISTVYRTALFHEQTIATLLRRFELLARSVMAEPDTSIDVLEIYSMTEKTERANQEKVLYQKGSSRWRNRETKAIDVSEFAISPVEPER